MGMDDAGELGKRVPSIGVKLVKILFPLRGVPSHEVVTIPFDFLPREHALDKDITIAIPLLPANATLPAVSAVATAQAIAAAEKVRATLS